MKWETINNIPALSCPIKSSVLMWGHYQDMSMYLFHVVYGLAQDPCNYLFMAQERGRGEEGERHKTDPFVALHHPICLTFSSPRTQSSIDPSQPIRPHLCFSEAQVPMDDGEWNEELCGHKVIERRGRRRRRSLKVWFISHPSSGGSFEWNLLVWHLVVPGVVCWRRKEGSQSVSHWDRWRGEGFREGEPRIWRIYSINRFNLMFMWNLHNRYFIEAEHGSGG